VTLRQNLRRRRRRRRQQWRARGDRRRRKTRRTKSSGQERAVGLKTHKSGGAGGVGGEEKLGCPEKVEGSKRRRRIGVRGP